jgi:hypothetical protein
MFRILSVCDVDLVVKDHRSTYELVSSLRPDGILRVAIELPEFFPGHRIVAAHPSVALTVNYLKDVADFAYGRR